MMGLGRAMDIPSIWPADGLFACRPAVRHAKTHHIKGLIYGLHQGDAYQERKRNTSNPTLPLFPSLASSTMLSFFFSLSPWRRLCKDFKAGGSINSVLNPSGFLYPSPHNHRYLPPCTYATVIIGPGQGFSSVLSPRLLLPHSLAHVFFFVSVALLDGFFWQTQTPTPVETGGFSILLLHSASLAHRSTEVFEWS